MIMLNYFCRKSVHSSFSKCGLGLIINETPRVSPNVIESSSVLVNVKPMTPSTLPRSEKRIGFIDDVCGGVDGFMLCTESLGSESCDGRRVDDDGNEYVEFCEEERERRRRKRTEEKRERKKEKKFPPPLSSLNQNGQPRFYLKPVRKNGRLELTEVNIQRPEILRAVRENGRLRLHLVNSDVCSRTNEEDENEEIKQEEQEHLEFHLHEEEKEEEQKVEQVRKYKVSGECWRCHELVMTHHHHHHHISDHHSLHVWRQPCVTR